MPLRPEPDVSQADWFARRDEPWIQLCTAGPSGFEQYARLFHAPADTDDVDVQNFEGSLPDALLWRLLAVLSHHTRTAEDCFFALWDGYGDVSHALLSQPRVSIPHRNYLLFRGRLEDAGTRWVSQDRPGSFPDNRPNLMWPGDRSWFVATEVDQPWTAIGGSAALISEVLADPELDAQPFLPSDHPPYWRR